MSPEADANPTEENIDDVIRQVCGDDLKETTTAGRCRDQLTGGACSAIDPTARLKFIFPDLFLQDFRYRIFLSGHFFTSNTGTSIPTMK